MQRRRERVGTQTRRLTDVWAGHEANGRRSGVFPPNHCAARRPFLIRQDARSAVSREFDDGSGRVSRPNRTLCDVLGRDRHRFCAFHRLLLLSRRLWCEQLPAPTAVQSKRPRTRIVARDRLRGVRSKRDDGRCGASPTCGDLDSTSPPRSVLCLARRPSTPSRRVRGRRAPGATPHGARRGCRRRVRAQMIASRSWMVSAMSGRFAATSSSRVSAVSVKPPRRRRTASSRTSWLGTVRPARRNGQRRTKATIKTSVNPTAAAQSLRAAGGIGWRRFRPGSRMLTTFGHTQIRHLPIGGSSRERAAPGRPGASPCSAPPVCGRTTSGACAGPLTGTRTARAGGPFSQWDLSVELGGADSCLRAVVRAELCPVVLVPDE